MGDVGAVVLRRIVDELIELEADIRGTSRFRFGVLDDYERALAKHNSMLEAWLDTVSHYPPRQRDETLRHYWTSIQYVRNKLLFVENLLSQKARLREWARHASKLGTFARRLSLLWRGINLITTFFGFPLDPSSLLSNGSARRLEYSGASARVSAYAVWLLNDDYTPMNFVVWVLRNVFGLPSQAAVALTQEIHRRGRGTCAVYARRAEAEAKVREVADLARQYGHPLMCVVEADG